MNTGDERRLDGGTLGSSYHQEVFCNVETKMYLRLFSLMTNVASSQVLITSMDFR